MKKLLNTLYITTQSSYLHKDGETVAVRLEDRDLLRVPIHTLESIVCFGRVSMSPPMMGFCMERKVEVSFLSEHGEFWAGLRGPVTGNILLRRQQHLTAEDDPRAARIVQSIVLAKIANCQTVLMRAQRERAEPSEALDGAIRRLARSLEHLLAVEEPVERLRGLEGDAARTYFSVFDELIVAQKDGFIFQGRSRRPPLDAVNALLSFLYTLLVHDVVGALEAVGLDPYAGFLHACRPGRPSLALDVMEELRPILADRLALTLINRQQIKASGFRKLDSGAVAMDDVTRKEVLQAWQKRKLEEVTHPFVGESASIGLFPHLQALLLARHLRGDLDAYPALVWKS
ncbi:MAG: type I-C CRISPR-associated endonuclease Cas1 [Acidobacteria bacterium]|nr:type I-C CRISPR-associated endonuclease Cas1 [Acidobacteriota bacterium]